MTAFVASTISYTTQIATTYRVSNSFNGGSQKNFGSSRTWKPKGSGKRRYAVVKLGELESGHP